MIKPLTDEEFEEVKHRFTHLDEYIATTHQEEAFRVVPFLISTIELQKSDKAELVAKIEELEAENVKLFEESKRDYTALLEENDKIKYSLKISRESGLQMGRMHKDLDNERLGLRDRCLELVEENKRLIENCGI